MAALPKPTNGTNDDYVARINALIDVVNGDAATPDESSVGVSTTVTTQGGSMTATATYTYERIADQVSVRVAAVISSVGTGTGYVDVVVPHLPSVTTPGSAVNLTSLLGLACHVHNDAGTGKVRIYKPDGTTPIAVASLIARVHYRTSTA
jgi:hypothetical protein